MSTAGSDVGRSALGLISLALLPAIWVATAGPRALGFSSVDLDGHLWTLWNASQGPMTRSAMVQFPEGLDLMPVVGGWLDIALGAPLVPVLGLLPAYNAVLGLYVLLAGLGGLALARSLGSGWGGALVAGLLLELDPFILLHLEGGRSEQVAIGLVALALAGAFQSWRQPGWTLAVLTGLAGAAVIFASWELAVALALAMVVLGPIVALTGSDAPGAPKRWAVAAFVAFCVSAPWVYAFATRAMEVRPPDEGLMALEQAARASIGWAAWWGAHSTRPGLLALLALGLAPALTQGRDRMRWLLLLGALGLVFLLALGPSPSASGQPTAPLVAWGPFAWLQALPGLGWLHWPDRLIFFWGLIAAAALGLLVDRCARIKPVAGLALGLLAVGMALARAQWEGRWPSTCDPLPHNAAAMALGEDPRPGAVLDLPVRPRGLPRYQYPLLQIAHKRPIFGHGSVPWVTSGLSDADRLGQDPSAAWLLTLDPRQPPHAPAAPFDPAALRERGFAWVSLHPVPRSRPWSQDAEATLRAVLGPPAYIDPATGWTAWAL